VKKRFKIGSTTRNRRKRKGILNYKKGGHGILYAMSKNRVNVFKWLDRQKKGVVEIVTWSIAKISR
jgi:hypothetical protein